MLRVLVIEDNPGDVRLISEMLAESGLDAVLENVATLADALGLLEEGGVDVVLLDLGLPDSQGMETLERVQEVASQTPVIVLTGNIDTRMALRAVETGAQDYLVKGGFDGEVLGRAIGYSIGRKSAEEALRRSEADLTRTNAQLEHMVYDVAEAMGRVVEIRDPYTQGHQTRVSLLAKAIADQMDLGSEVAAAVAMAGLVHDIGKLSVPADILSKPGSLGAVEMLLIREHPVRGFEILKDIAFPWPIAEIVRQHHERTDGSGYPDGPAADGSLIEARILAVADVVEAMASHRPYRPAHPLTEALREIDENRHRYDPAVVDACLALHDSGVLQALMAP